MSRSSTIQLSEIFPSDHVIRDGAFTQFDEVSASVPGSLVYCATPGFLAQAEACSNVAAIITTPELSASSSTKPLVAAANPRLAFFRAYRDLKLAGRIEREMEFGRGAGCRIHPTAVISERSRLGDGVEVDAFAVIGPHVELQSGVHVGAGAKLGVDGLMPVWDENGNALRFTHAGAVSIGRNTVVLAGTVIVTSVFQRPTTVGPDCYIGIMTNIGHDVSIGSRCVIGGNCIISGGARLEDESQVWASSSIAQGCSVGRGAKVHMGSVVVQNVPAAAEVSGNYAHNHRRHATAHFKHS